MMYEIIAKVKKEMPIGRCICGTGNPVPPNSSISELILLMIKFVYLKKINGSMLQIIEKTSTAFRLSPAREIQIPNP